MSCKTQSNVEPAESDGINPTTAFEIYDSLAPVNGTILKNMQTVRTIFTYNGDYPPVSHQMKENFEYEYDEKQRLIKCVYKADRYPNTRITRLGGTVNGFMNYYSTLSYDTNKNIQKVTFGSFTRDGKLEHESALAELEYTKYVRSPLPMKTWRIKAPLS